MTRKGCVKKNVLFYFRFVIPAYLSAVLVYRR